ncbi:MAG: UDP-N-acetylglucosamine--N-acetylmuramyl-(pentapeptide) pyrophosphoryl-undecaprenol N-acetylglucosamine transferase, partial [Chitinophagaceae bacterium]|nr:UDP-N-acetylglucosamine--N-acetylmuramyl-(pentapeptide) pyrophosphoryl-undecaprenol N-acetylglucosamine transferase [Chitinophagaceae bacterium]
AIAQSTVTRSEGIHFFGLDESKKTVLAVGGSLGARSINEALATHLDEFANNNLQLIWQTGKPTSAEYKNKAIGHSNIWCNDFITQMEMAYAAADIVISRAGAMAVTELCVCGKASVLVPYPLAAEDHQTANAKNLVDMQAAILIRDSEANEKLVSTVIVLSKNESLQQWLKANIATLAIKNADEVIANEILKAIA